MSTRQPIAVGVDGSEGGGRALRWAVAEAAQLGVGVQAIIVWRWDGIETLPPLSYAPADERLRAEQLLHRAVLELPTQERRGVHISSRWSRGARRTSSRRRAVARACWSWAATGTAEYGTPCWVR